MTLRYNRCQLLPVAVVMVVLATSFVTRASGEDSAMPEEATIVDTRKTSTEALPPWQRMLSGRDSVLIAELEEQITELREEGDYAEAIPLAEQILDIRRRVQGEDHWEVINALNSVETLKYVSDLPREARAELAEADKVGPATQTLREQGRYDEGLDLLHHQLDTRRRTLGSEHPWVATSLNNVARLLYRMGDYGGAEPLFREALAMRRKLLGEEHLDVAASLNNLAALLADKGDYATAEPLFQEALAMKRKLLGEEHASVAASLNNLAVLLKNRGEYGGAEPLCREALAMRRKLLGDEHPDVAASLNNLAVLLMNRGEYAAAEPLYREVLAMRRKLLGDEHPDVAASLNNLAVLLYQKGDYAGAEPLYREALAMRRKLLGEEHLDVAISLNNLAALLADKGDYAAAEPLFQEALAMRHKLLGEEHPSVAASLNNLAALLKSQGDYAGAEPLHREALAMRRKLLGDEHPDVAASLNNLARLLHGMGNRAGAEPLYREAVAMRRKLLGEEHPDVAASRSDLARQLHDSGKYQAAETTWEAAVESFEAARLRTGPGGLERVGFAAGGSPLAQLAVCLARNAKVLRAWERMEAGMGRGLLDAMSSRESRPLEPEERKHEESLLGRLEKLDEQISTLLVAQDPAGENRARADTLRWERDALQAEFAQFEADMAARYGVAAGEMYGLEHIRAHLSEDDALLAWVDMEGHPHAVDPSGEHWACVVKCQGDPIWVKLPGGGEDGAWTGQDDSLPRHVRQVLSRVSTRWEDDQAPELVRRLRDQRVTPIEPHLQGVTHLIVLPAGCMAGVPVEALTEAYTVNYAPSATMYAWLRERAEGCTGDGAPSTWGEAQRKPLLALGDPVFEQSEESDTVLPEPPEKGVLLAMVASESNAERSGLREGDVLMSYRGEMLAGPEELGSAIEVAAAGGDSVVTVTVWREGETVEMSVAPGKLGVRLSEQPVPEAVALKRRLDRVLETTRGRAFVALPWTRVEVEGIAELFNRDETASTILLGPDASERRLDELASSGELGKHRYIHLATHAVMDDEMAMRSALILSQDPVADSFERALQGLEVYDGRLTAEQIVRTWNIDADLVTLSACGTALGRESGGEGFLGFSQALFVAGARSLVLTLWKVQDTPAMLLMRRFYENLLGRFDEPRVVGGQEHDSGIPIPKAEALREAKQWLRGITWEQLPELEIELWSGDARGSGETPAPATALPYEDPHYWAAFILMGCPD